MTEAVRGMFEALEKEFPQKAEQEPRPASGGAGAEGQGNAGTGGGGNTADPDGLLAPGNTLQIVQL